MITNNNLKEMRNRLDALKSANLAEIEKVNAQIETARQMLDKATDAAAEAYAKGDEKAYHRASDNIRIATDALEMYRTKLDELATKPLVTEREYKDSVDAVMAELDSVVAKARRDILPLVEQLNKINDAMLDAISYGDAILYDLQRKVFKDTHSERDVMYDPNGRKQDVSWAVDSITEATEGWRGE